MAEFTAEQFHEFFHGPYDRCDRLGIDGEQCPMPGFWRPVLLLPAPHPAPADVAVQVILKMCICSIHKSYCGLDDFVTDESWQSIADVIVKAGRVAPDRGRASLTWHELPRKHESG